MYIGIITIIICHHHTPHLSLTLLLLWLIVKYYCLIYEQYSYKQALLSNAARTKTDYYFVGYPGHIDMFVIKLVALIKNKPLIFDAFVSLYDSMIFDRKVIKKDSFVAKILFYLDKWSCNMADLIILIFERSLCSSVV